MHAKRLIIIGFALLSLLSITSSVVFAQDSSQIAAACAQLGASQVRFDATGIVYDCTTLLPVGVNAAIPTQEFATLVPEVVTDGQWQIEEVFGLTDLMRNVWISGLESLPASPELWPTFPNIPNPLVPSFRIVNGNEVPDGLEYGQDIDIFCQQDLRCDFNVAARSYRLYTGDYDFPAVGESCNIGDTGIGCAISVWNVGDVTALFENQSFDRGFTVAGRYWNGDVLHIAMSALMSHAAANMLNLSELNPSGGANAGANCSVPSGCQGVNLVIVVTSGNEVLWKARTTVTR